MYCRCAGIVYLADPVISASQLEALATEAHKVGATRYAEAYLLVARRLRGASREGGRDE